MEGCGQTDRTAGPTFPDGRAQLYAATTASLTVASGGDLGEGGFIGADDAREILLARA